MKFLVADHGELCCKVVTDQIFDLEIEGEVGKAYALAAQLNAQAGLLGEAVELLKDARRLYDLGHEVADAGWRDLVRTEEAAHEKAFAIKTSITAFLARVGSNKGEAPNE